MPTVIENKLDRLLHEIIEIKKELIIQKIQTIANTTDKMKQWRALGVRVSDKWDHGTAVDEIRAQRKKM
ncbi:MAG: hypothetical protein WCO89_09395 [Syntrophus sp. (in: bacteria)]